MVSIFYIWEAQTLLSWLFGAMFKGKVASRHEIFCYLFLPPISGMAVCQALNLVSWGRVVLLLSPSDLFFKYPVLLEEKHISVLLALLPGAMFPPSGQKRILLCSFLPSVLSPYASFSSVSWGSDRDLHSMVEFCLCPLLLVPSLAGALLNSTYAAWSQVWGDRMICQPTWATASGVMIGKKTKYPEVCLVSLMVSVWMCDVWCWLAKVLPGRWESHLPLLASEEVFSWTVASSFELRRQSACVGVFLIETFTQ